MVPARRELPGRIGDDPIATAPPLSLRRSLAPTFRLEFLSLGAGVPTNPARRSFCSTCSGRLMARSPPRADVDFFFAITIGGGDRVVE